MCRFMSNLLQIYRGKGSYTRLSSLSCVVIMMISSAASWCTDRKSPLGCLLSITSLHNRLPWPISADFFEIESMDVINLAISLASPLLGTQDILVWLKLECYWFRNSSFPSQYYIINGDSRDSEILEKYSEKWGSLQMTRIFIDALVFERAGHPTGVETSRRYCQRVPKLPVAREVSFVNLNSVPSLSDAR